MFNNKQEIASDDCISCWNSFAKHLGTLPKSSAPDESMKLQADSHSVVRHFVRKSRALCHLTNHDDDDKDQELPRRIGLPFVDRWLVVR